MSQKIDSKEPSPGDRRAVAQPDSVIEAEAICSALQSAGIEAFVETQTMGTLFPHQAQALGGIRVTVWKKDYTEAIEFLQSDAQALPNEPVPAEWTNDDPQTAHFYQYSRYLKNAWLCVGIGWMIPLVPVWGFICLNRARQASPKHFQESRLQFVLIGVALVLALVSSSYLGALYLLIQNG